MKSLTLLLFSMVCAYAQTNLAVGKAASQSSTLCCYGPAAAASAVDGNTDGTFFDGSVAHTNMDTNAWWQVDLGSSASVGSIVIWNRTDCCSDRLGDYWIFVSDTPFGPSDTPATLSGRAGTWYSHQLTYPNPSATIGVYAQGRYVRVQLSGTNFLSLAEVQVIGTSGGAGINSFSPTSGVGTTLFISSSFNGGASGAPILQVEIAGTASGTNYLSPVQPNSCVIYLGINPNWPQSDPHFGTLGLWNDAGSAIGPGAISLPAGLSGSGYVTQSSNSQCTVTQANSYVTSSGGANYNVGISVSLAAGFTGAKTISAVVNPLQQGAHWTQYGTWNSASVAPRQSSGVPSIGPLDDYAGENLAVGKATAQSSNGQVGIGPEWAVDGNTNGTWGISVTHTGYDLNAWWQVDLGASGFINSILLWNRTDCCPDRLSNYWVFVSDTPFGPSDTPATLSNRAGTFANYQAAYPNPVTSIGVNYQGRYVRVQLAGTNYLSLAEVQVIGKLNGYQYNAVNPVSSSVGSGGSPMMKIIGRHTPGVRPRVITQRSDTKFRFRMHDGRITEHPRADVMRAYVSAKWEQQGTEYMYSLDIDTRDAQHIRLGNANTGPDSTIDGPAGWIGSDTGWVAEDIIPGRSVSRDEHSQFSVRSKMMPGPLAVYMQNKDWMVPFTILPGMGSQDQSDIVDQITYENNSRKFLVIGPAIPVGTTVEALRDLIQGWVDAGVEFLAPMLEYKDVMFGLNTLTPADEYGKQVVECIRQALLNAAVK